MADSEERTQTLWQKYLWGLVTWSQHKLLPGSLIPRKEAGEGVGATCVATNTALM